MTPDPGLKLAIYHHVAETGRVPSLRDMEQRSGETRDELRAGYRRLAAQRVLVLEEDGETIRMAPPFSGVETQHLVRAGGREYFANCAWDALGVLAALQASGRVLSRCEQTREPLHLQVGHDGPEPEPCIIHFAVPAAHWWDDIVYT